MKKRAVAVAAAAALASLSAAAQTAAPAPAAAASAPEPAPAAAAAPTPAAAHAAEDLQRVVVTAQKRKEDILSVPLAISVVSGDQLKSALVSNSEDLTRNMPNMSFSTQAGPGLGTLEIRGVSSQAGSATVSVYVDDVSLTTRNLYSQGTAEPILLDIDHVEVLRGPQGTLYGASSLGGTVKYISNAPDLVHFSGNASAEVSKTQGAQGWNYQADGVINVPLVKGRAALRVAVEHGHDAGWINQLDYLTLKTIARGINSSDRTAVKASLKADMGNGWSVTPAIMAQQVDTDDIDAYYLHVGGDQVTPYAGQPVPRFTTTKQVREPGRDRLDVPSLTVEGDIGIGEFTGVLSSYKRRFNRVQDGTSINSVYIGQVTTNPVLGQLVQALPSAVDLNNQIDQNSLELRVASKDYDPKGGSALTWIGGFYTAKAKTQVYDNEPVFGINALFAQYGADPQNPADLQDAFPNDFVGDSSYYSARHYQDKQNSVFGELTYHVGPSISATAGLRYVDASQHFTREGNYYYAGGPSSAVIDSKATASTPSFKVNWTIDPTTSVYANIAKGFRLGGANRPVPDTPLVESDLALLGLPNKPPASYAPDSLWSYEVGSKQRLLDNRLTLNLAAFFIDWKNIQQDISLPNAGFDFETNVGKAHSYGLEAELRARVNENLDVTASGGWTHAVFAEDVPAFGTDGNGVFNVRKGDAIQGVPTGNVSAGFDYHWDVNGDVGAFVRGNGQWTGRSHGSLFRGDTDYNRPSYFNFDASGGVDFGRWEITAFVKNLANNHTVIQQPSIQNVAEAYTLKPRTIGVKVSADF